MRGVESTGCVLDFDLRLLLSQRVTFTPSSDNVASEIFSRDVSKADGSTLSKIHKGNSKLDKGEKHVCTYVLM